MERREFFRRGGATLGVAAFAAGATTRAATTLAAAAAGLPGAPVEWYDDYTLTEVPYAQFAQQEDAADTIGFAENLQQETTPEIGPHGEDLPPGSHPFPVRYARRSTPNLDEAQRSVSAIAELNAMRSAAD